jgi:hypothetical protein
MKLFIVGIFIAAFSALAVPKFIAAPYFHFSNKTGGPVEIIVRCFPGQQHTERAVFEEGQSMTLLMGCPSEGE